MKHYRMYFQTEDVARKFLAGTYEMCRVGEINRVKGGYRVVVVV